MRYIVLLTIAFAALLKTAWAENTEIQVQDKVALIEALLEELGYDPGPVDGLAGPLTTAAIGEYQANAGKPVTAQVTEDLVNQLMASALAKRFSDFEALDEIDLDHELPAQGSAIPKEMIEGMRSTGAFGGN